MNTITSHRPPASLPPLASCRAAFTLLEIMLVVMIIAVLAGSAIHLLRGNLETAKIHGRINPDLENIKTQLQMYETFNGSLPTTEQGLAALVTKPSAEPAPRRWQQLMPSIPMDPFGTPYQYRLPATKSKEAFDVFSIGKDHLPDTADDIGNWE